MFVGMGSTVCSARVLPSSAVRGVLRKLPAWSPCLLHVTPPSMLVATYVDTRVTDASDRVSYHIATTAPVTGSVVMVGRNWGRAPSVKLSVIASSFTWTGWLQLGDRLSESSDDTM